MNTFPTSPPGAHLQPTALVIEPILPHLMAVLSALSPLEFDATVAQTYRDAKTVLSTQQPALLVTGLKLREYNGLHLISYGTHRWQHLRAVVTTDAFDPVLQAETERLGATFVVMPVSDDELVAAICRTALRHAGASGPIRAPFERRSTACECSTSPSPAASGIERRRAISEAIQALIR